ncbi:MAG TPA: PilC/PilY family type IV pilus protein [Burkholderiaceae bacterium]|nr:PilC/PilY family type IV pilus protein [Burkholderiaceae bacterium]
MRSNPRRLSHVLRGLLAAQALGIFAVTALAPTTVRAAPITPPASLAQTPLFVQSPPAPNVFITIDNSGSMVEEVLPDPTDGTLPTRMFPITLRSPYNSTGDGQPTTNLTGTALKFVGFSHHINVASMRAAGQNLLYYDPRIRYRPWKTADTAGNFFSYPEAADPASGATTALYNPFFPSRGGLNLAANSIALSNYTVLENVATAGTGTYTARFDATNPTSALVAFALYYNFDTTLPNCNTSSPAASAADLNCYQRVEIKPSVGMYTIPAGNQRGQADEPGCALSGAVMQCDYNSEFKNFANWFTYYRARTLLARGAVGNAVADLGAGFRIGLGLINPTANSTGPADGYSSTTVRLGVRDFSGVNVQPFFNLLQNHDVAGSTPSGSALMEVGNYFDWKTTGGSPVATGPWSNDPGSGLTQFASCRQSYHVYSTDGYWNENADALFNGLAAPAQNADSTMYPPAAQPPICRDTAAPTGQPTCFRYDPTATGALSGPAFNSFGPPGPNNLGNPNNRRFPSPQPETLADIAMYFWYRDLQPGMPNTVAPSSADPAFWQHLSLMAIALAFTGTVTSQGDTFLNNLDSGAIDPSTGQPYAWPIRPGQPNGNLPQTADDLWHAAVNSRGRFLTANNPANLSTQLQAALNEIRSRAAVGAAAASSTAFLDTGNGVFTSEISQGTWSGNVYRREIDTTTMQFKTTDASGNPLPLDANGVPYEWRASDQLAVPTSRPIYTMRYGSTARDALVQFVPNNGTLGVDPTQMADLTATQGSATNVINYLRGDRTQELSAVPAGPFRDRPRLTSGVPGSLNDVFGTFANSSPIYVQADDFGYDFLPTTVPGQSTYLAFLRANQGSGTTPGRQATLWTGSNEGMFHAFNADTGAELFAYVPRAAVPNLQLLVDPKYTHRYIVDGVPAVGDAFIGPPGGGPAAWRTVVVSSLGAGGRALFAVDATNPANLATAGANNVYWEIGQQSMSAANFNLLGSTLGPAIIAFAKDNTLTAGGRWVAIFANGPASNAQRAALFVVDLQSGSVLSVLDTGSGDVNNPNGLSTPAPLYDVNRQLVAVYAGDLLGNVWKFDFSGNNPSTWNVAFGTNPLFTTRSPANVGPATSRDQPQPIFAKPLLRRHPDGGVMVLFGTGKLFEPGDRENSDVQSFYGVWDQPSATTGLTGNFRTNGTLVQQAITSMSGTPAMYFMTNLGVTYSAGQLGWFFDLGVTYSADANAVDTSTANQITPRERVIVPAISVGDNMFVQSFVPSIDSCDTAGVSFLYGLNFLTGGFLGTGSFNNVDNTGAISMPGSLGMLPFLERLAAGENPNDRTGRLFSIDLSGGLSNQQFNVGGLGAFRTWRQLLD